MQPHTENLMLVLQSTEDILAWVDVLDAATRAEISPDWLARIRTSTTQDPWTHSFTIMHRASGVIIGSCAYKGPPDADETVEIAYGVNPEYQGRGFATEAAQALVDYAMSSSQVRVVRAHTARWAGLHAGAREAWARIEVGATERGLKHAPRTNA